MAQGGWYHCVLMITRLRFYCEMIRGVCELPPVMGSVEFRLFQFSCLRDGPEKIGLHRLI